jgi:DNA-binding CsgD family transcriptional regulator
MLLLENLMHGLAGAGDREQAWSAASEFFHAMGFDRLVYLDTRLDTTSGDLQVRTTFPDAWRERYVQEDYATSDPFIRYCCASTSPVSTGKAYLDDYAYLNARERLLIEEAAHFGAQAGFSVTARTLASGPPAGWNLCSSQCRKEIEAVRRHHEPMLRLAALYAHERLCALPASRDTAQNLSPRERQCLALVARGMRVKEVASRLGLAPVTVELHLRNARVRLGVATRDEAVARATFLGQIAL